MKPLTEHRKLILVLVYCAIYVALWFVVPYIPAINYRLLALLVATIATTLFMFSQLSVTRWFSGMSMKPAAAVAVLLVSAGLWLATVYAVTAPYSKYEVSGIGSIPKKLANPPQQITVSLKAVSKSSPTPRTIKATAVRRPADLKFRLFVFDAVAGKFRAVTSLLMVLAATAFGYLLSFILRHPNILVPVAGFSAYIDIWTVMFGPTGRALENSPHVVKAVSVAMPAIGGAAKGFEPISFIGPADFIFTAMFFGALYRMKLDPNRTFWILFPMLTIGMLAVLTGLPIPGLPALVLIGPVTIIANFRHFKLTRDEWKAMIVVGVVLTAATIALIPIFGRK